MCVHLLIIYPGNVMNAVERLAIRLEPAEKKKIEALSKKRKITVTQFVLDAVRLYVRLLERERENTITLSQDEYQALVRLILEPREPNEKLKAAAKRLQKIRSDLL